MKVRLLFGIRFGLLALAGLLVGLAFSSPAPAQEAPDSAVSAGGLVEDALFDTTPADDL